MSDVEDEEAEPRPTPRRASFRKFPRVLADAVWLVWRATGRRLVLVGFLQLATGLGAGLQLVAARWLLDDVLEAHNASAGMDAVIPELLLLLGVITLSTGATVVLAEYQRVLGELVNRYVQGRVLDVAVSVDLESYESSTFYDRLQRAFSGGQTRPWQMTVSLLSLASAAVTTLAIVGVLVSIQPLLLPLVLLAYVPLALTSVANSRAAHTTLYGLTALDRERGYYGNLMASRRDAKEVRLFALAPFLRRRYDALYATRIADLERLMRERLSRSIAGTVLSSALSVAVLAVLIALLLADRMDVASATAAAVGLQQLGGRMQLVYGNAGGLFEGSLFVNDYREFLALQPPPPAADLPPAPPSFQRLDVQDVTYRYPGASTNALNGVSLDIHAGQVVALVGENGSGKTTLAKLLSGLLRPTTGTIAWDGVDVAEYDPEALRRGVTCLFQDFGWYELTAGDNIAIGRTERLDDTDGVIDAARRAGADSFLSRLPKGYRTRLGRYFASGVDLSIGQWQRVALARALFRDADFIILDEPTAALDPRVEHELFQSVRELAEGKTIVIISHRFSTVRSADHIFVLDGGTVVERGNHTELMAAGGLYAELFTLQASSYVEEARSADGVEEGGHGLVEQVPMARAYEAPGGRLDEVE